MPKIAAFLKFNKKIQSEVLNYKKKVKIRFGNQIYLSHPVHSTLFTLDIKKIKDLKNLYQNLKIKKKNKSQKILVTSTGAFYNDPLTNGHTLYYKIKKSTFLSSLQLKHLKLINQKITVLKKNAEIYKNQKLKKNYLKYGFPFSGKIWVPHITVASIRNIKRNNKFIDNFLNKNIRFKNEINEIEFYKVNNNKHFFLFKTKNI